LDVRVPTYESPDCRTRSGGLVSREAIPRGDIRGTAGGFTLVEFAIVLVIVGLIVGAVLKGQELITNARIKRVEQDHSSTVVAVQAYQDRYGFLPGDDPDAETRFEAYSAGSGYNGDGNGEIGWSGAFDFELWDDPPPNATENNGFWAHLRASGLVGGAAADRRQPVNAYGGMIGVQARAFADTFSPPTYLRHAIMFGKIPGGVARILEDRLDDGQRNGGSMRARESVSLQFVTISPYGATYLDDTVYDIGLRM
jgi:type II secretory pathway pseudopilin PulG